MKVHIFSCHLLLQLDIFVQSCLNMFTLQKRFKQSIGIVFLYVIAVKCPVPTIVPNVTSKGDLREFIYGESIIYTCIRGHRFSKAGFGANVSSVNVTCTVSNRSETTGNWSHFLPSCESK